ncbi:Exopolygalacturonase [Platanthera zijinensis]|uniref:Exopolygalacturonase n=1 Tax=Platanthera zijinensis TaxID=2320716 RepID=A0AAP0ASX5_9ASPA
MPSIHSLAFIFFLFPLFIFSSLAVDIKNYGAVPDGETDSTEALQKAWTDACETENDGATIEIPEGSYLIGPVMFKGPCKSPNLSIHLAGALLAKEDLNLYKPNWIEFQYINGLNLYGPGKMDGRGGAAWAKNGCRQTDKSDCKTFPMNMVFSFVNNASISGITSIDSKYFHVMVFSCKNITIDSVTVTAPGDSPNTDGIHIAGSENVLVQSSTIGTGDDCISVGDNTVNLNVTGVTCGPGHGISIGSLGRYPNEQDVVGLTVKNCTFNGTLNGVRIKTWQNGPKYLEVRDLVFENITMNDVDTPIAIDQKYCPSRTCPSNLKPSRVKISNVQFNNITGTSAGKTAISIVCSDSFPCDDVQLDNIDLRYNGPGEADATCINVKPKIIGTVNPVDCAS